MKKLSKIAAVLIAAATMVSMTACGGGDGASSAKSAESSGAASGEASGKDSSTAQSSVDKIKADGYITMSTNAEFEPFEFKDGEDFAGIDIEISQKIAEKLGVELRINDVAFDSLIPELSAGKGDFVAAGMTADDDRRKNVDFTDNYFNASQAIIVLKDSAIKTAADLNGKKVGVQQGTTGDTYCTNENGKSEVKVGSVERYNKGMDAVTDLISGRLDAVVIDNFPADKFVSKNADKIVKLDEELTQEEYAIAVKKGNQELLDVINGVLKELKDSGEMDQIVSKYISE